MIILLSLLAAFSPQDVKKASIEATVQDLPASGKDGPAFILEGTTDLPDRYRIDIYAYFGVPDPGYHVRHDVAIVRDGKFRAAVSMFKTTNLAGEYSFRLVGDPNLQEQRFGALPPFRKDVSFKLGKPGEAEKARAEVHGRLLADLKALVAVADEAAALRKSEKESGKTDTAAWDRLLKEWYKRLKESATKAQQVVEYRVLGLSGFVDHGIEQICGITMDIARCAARGSDKDVREGRERLDITMSNFEGELTGRPLDPKLTRLELIRTARRLLAAGAMPKEEAAPAGRNAFFQVLLQLNPLLPPDERPGLVELSAGTRELFDAVDDKKEIKELYKKLDGRLETLLQTLQNEK